MYLWAQFPGSEVTQSQAGTAVCLVQSVLRPEKAMPQECRRFKYTQALFLGKVCLTELCWCNKVKKYLTSSNIFLIGHRKMLPFKFLLNSLGFIYEVDDLGFCLLPQ